MKKIIYILLAIVVAGVIFFAFSNRTNAPVNQNTENATDVAMRTIRMESGAFYFSPNKISVKKGERVTVYITSKGNHTFTLDEFGVNVPTPDGQVTKVEFTPDKSGTFTFYCAIPGHKESGQVGTITVE